jgi:hypothetical protein
MTDHCSVREIEILACLDLNGGFTTPHVARRISTLSTNPRSHAAQTRQMLLRLKERGLVRFLDDQKPDCWCLTASGKAIAKGAS